MSDFPAMPGASSMPTASSMPAASSTNEKKRKRNLIPLPLPPSKTPKSRVQARVASNAAQVLETVDLLSQSNNNIKILQDITFRPNNIAVNESEARRADELHSETDVLMPSTQTVVNTIFEDAETTSAIEALIASLDRVEDASRTSPDIFAESEDQFKTDTIMFLQEKVALLQTRINISENDIKLLKSEESILNRKLHETRSMLGKKERYLAELENTLKKFEVFRDAL